MVYQTSVTVTGMIVQNLLSTEMPAIPVTSQTRFSILFRLGFGNHCLCQGYKDISGASYMGTLETVSIGKEDCTLVVVGNQRGSANTWLNCCLNL